MLELKDPKVSDPKVVLKPKFAKKKSLRLRFVKVGIGHPPAQMPMSGARIKKTYLVKVDRSADILGVVTFPDQVGHFGPPSGIFGFSRRCGIAGVN